MKKVLKIMKFKLIDNKILLKKGINTIGRKGINMNILIIDCNIKLMSNLCSRKHAIIDIKIDNYDVYDLLKECVKIFIKDCSKSGTFVNNVKINKDKNIEINSGDKIFFGTPDVSYTIIYNPYIATLSRIPKQEKLIIENEIHELGGYITRQWNDKCNIVIVNDDCECIFFINIL